MGATGEGVTNLLVEAVGGAEAEPGPGYRGHETGLALLWGLVAGPGLGCVHLCLSSSGGGLPRLRILDTSLLSRDGDS